MYTERQFLTDAFESLPEASTVGENKCVAEYFVICRDLLASSIDHEYGFIDGIREIRVYITFEKDTTRTDTKGWVHLHTNIKKVPFRRPESYIRQCK